MICYKCYAYEHTKFRCKGVAKCRNCSNVHDLEGECKAAPFCQHCQGQHGPASRTCPTYALEKEIFRLRFTKGINYQEALKQIRAGGGSYASVSKVQERLVTARGSPESQQMKEKDDLIKQLMDTIAKLTTRIEELEKKNKDKKDKKRAKRMQASKEEESWSEMETDSSIQQSTGQTGDACSQVSVAHSKSSIPKHKRHPTTEIHPPVPKKPLANPNIFLDQKQNSPQPPLTMKNPANPYNIVDQSQSSMDSHRPDSLHTQLHHGQQNNPYK